MLRPCAHFGSTAWTGRRDRRAGARHKYWGSLTNQRRSNAKNVRTAMQEHSSVHSSAKSTPVPTSFNGVGPCGPVSTHPPPFGARDALDGKGPQRRPQKRLDRRLEEGAKAVGGGDCRLQMPLKLAFAVRETLAGHRLGALEGGTSTPHTGGTSPPCSASLAGAPRARSLGSPSPKATSPLTHFQPPHPPPHYPHYTPVPKHQ